MPYKDMREEWSVEMLLHNEEQAKGVLMDMRNHYRDASDAITEDIKRILGAVISRNKLEITPDELRKQLSKAEVRTWKKTVADYMDEIEALGGRNSVKGQVLWMELEYLSALTRVTRLEALQMSIDANMARVAALEDAEITTFLENILRDDYYSNMYSYYLMDVPAVNVLVETSGVAMTNSFVQTITNEAWLGHTLSERIWKNEHDIAYRLRTVLSQTLIAGRSVNRVSKDLSEQMNVSFKNAQRLVLTETARVKTMADMKSYEDAGFDRVEWCATLDSRTCSDCGNLDGKIMDMSKINESNKPPLHPRCRCCLMPVNDYIEDLEGKFSFTRFARDKNEKKIWVDGKMSYNEWRNKFM